MKTRLFFAFCALLFLGAFAATTNNTKKKVPVQRRQAATGKSMQTQQGMRGFQTVTVTGKGESLEGAREDAKRNALAQVVGEAIKAKTEIKENGDEASVISKFLSASAGFIAKFEETSTSNEGGIFAVTANVTVYSEKLLEAVTFGDDSSELFNEVKQARVGSDMEETREKMTKYICSYLLDYCRIWSITAKELIPGYDNGGQPVLYANCYFGTTPAKYQMYLKRLNAAMARIGARSGAYKHELTKSHTPVQYVIRPDNQANETTDGGNPGKGWVHLWLSSKFLENQSSFGHEFNKYGYRITFKLLDEQDNVIATKEIGIGTYHGQNTLPSPRMRYGFKLTPLKNENNKTCYRRKCHVKFDEFASSEEMLKVKRIAAFVEPVKMTSAPTVDFRQYVDKDMKWGWYEK